MRPFALLILPLFASASLAAEPSFLFDVLRKPHYRLSWEKLMKDVQPTPDWLLQFSRNFDGASGEMIPVTIEGKPYEVSYVCKPTDCSDHRFGVMFDADGMHAYGALGGKDDAPSYFGAPPALLQEALAKAVKG